MRRSRERRIPICSSSPHRTEHRIVDDEENIPGFTILSFTKTFDPRWESHVYISAFRVLKQGQGIGTRLMLRLAQEIRDEGTINLIYGTQRDPLGRPYRIRLHIPGLADKNLCRKRLRHRPSSVWHRAGIARDKRYHSLVPGDAAIVVD